MTDPLDFDSWPDYLPGPRNDILALGVVSLNYGHLENIFRILFGFAADMSEDQVIAIFDRITNHVREQALRQMLETRPLPNGLNDLIRFFLEGYAICASNRHAVMHSHHGGIHTGARGTSGIVLSKISRSGSELVCFAHAAQLRTVADAIDQQSVFGTEIILALQSFRLCQKEKRVQDFERVPLPKKPPLPTELIWRTPPEAHRRAATSPE